MVESKSLAAREAVFEFQVGERDWCHLLLQWDKASFTLGAEVFGVLVRKLLAFLDGRSKLHYTFRADDLDWAWFLTLSERHCSLYARRIDGAYVLRVHDARARKIAEFRIDEAEAARWAAELTKWLDEKAGSVA